MTAITISAPRTRLPHRSTAPASRQAGGPPRSSVARSHALRLTRRGRLVITALLLAIGVTLSLFAGGISLAGTAAQPVPVRYVTVTPGETLWGIAGEVAPNADRRDTVARILEINALPGASLQAGQRIAVPTR